MEKINLLADRTFEALTELVQEMSHTGLIITVMRPAGFDLPGSATNEVTECISFGGCSACLANAIAQKMIDDSNFCTVITAAAELYTNSLYNNNKRLKCSDNG